jgi:hypothetical protein
MRIALPAQPGTSEVRCKRALDVSSATTPQGGLHRRIFERGRHFGRLWRFRRLYRLVRGNAGFTSRREAASNLDQCSRRSKIAPGPRAGDASAQ